MNIVSSDSSSPSSEEDKMEVANNAAMPTGITEVHLNKHCKYKRCKGSVDGVTVRFHIRICKCSSVYTDRSALENSKMDCVVEDGKDIHFDKACYWQRPKGTGCVQKEYVLKQFCNGCHMPQKNASSSAINKV